MTFPAPKKEDRPRVCERCGERALPHGLLDCIGFLRTRDHDAAQSATLYAENARAAQSERNALEPEVVRLRTENEALRELCTQAAQVAGTKAHREAWREWMKAWRKLRGAR